MATSIQGIAVSSRRSNTYAGYETSIKGFDIRYVPGASGAGQRGDMGRPLHSETLRRVVNIGYKHRRRRRGGGYTLIP